MLQRELQIKLAELEDKWHYTYLEKIFFEEKIYKELEKKHESWEKVIDAIAKAFVPFSKQLRRAIAREDLLKLTEKPVRRIYKLDIDELNAQIKNIDDEIGKVKYDLEHLTEFAIAYFEGLIKKYGKNKSRKTDIKLFETITAKQVAVANSKLYINRTEGFVGTGLKKDEFLCDCSNLDDIIVFTKRGTMKVVRVADKTFIGKDILHAAIFQKNDERTTYNMIYMDGETGIGFAKRFNVTGITRDKEYDLTKGNDKSKVLYFSANPNGEAETVKIILSPNSNARNKELDFSFEEIDIKGRSSIGNQVTKHAIRSVKFKEKGRPTLAGRKLWYDDVYNRLNADGKGKYVGSFEGDEKILVIYSGGYYELTDTELAQRFQGDKVILIEKFDPEKIISAIYFDNEKKQYNVKRFKIETTTLHNRFYFVKEGVGNVLENATTSKAPVLLIQTGKGQTARTTKFKIDKLVDVMGWKAIGTKLMDVTKTNITTGWDQPASAKDDGAPELFG